MIRSGTGKALSVLDSNGITWHTLSGYKMLRNLFKNPSFETASGTADVRVNLATNPSFEKSSGTTTVRTNYARNPNFELDVANWIAESGAIITQDTVNPISGTASAKVTNGGDVYTTAPAQPGQVWTFSLDYKTSGSTGTPQIYMSDNNGAAVFVPLPLDQPTPGRFSASITTAAGTTQLIAAVFAPAVGSTMWIDNVLLEQSPIVQPYFDGGHPVNFALGATVTSSQGVASNLERFTDGVFTNFDSYAQVNAGDGVAGWLQVDLGSVQAIDSVKVWHYCFDLRTYHETKVEVSADGVTWVTVFDSAVSGEYVEQQTGHEVTFPMRGVRYIRDWLNGSDTNAGSHWIELQAFNSDFNYAWTGAANASSSIQRAPAVNSVAGNGDATVWQSSAYARFGTKSAASRAGGVGSNYSGLLSETQTLTAGNTYTFSAWVYLPAAYGQGVKAVVNMPGIGVVEGTAATTIGEGTRVSVTFTPTLTTTALVYTITSWGDRSATVGQVFYTDGWMLEQSPVVGAYFDGANPIKNWATNPSPRVNDTNWGNQWYGGAGSGTFARSAGTGMDGGYSMRKTWTTAQPNAQDVGANYTESIVAGKTYSFSGHMKPSVPANIVPYVSWLDSSLAPIGPAPAGALVDSPAGVYTRAGFTATAPAGASYARFVWGPYGAGANIPAGGTLDFDRVLIEESATINHYYEGTGDFTYGWYGATDESASYARAALAAGTDYIPSLAYAYQSKALGPKSLRITPVNATNGDSFAEISPMLSGFTFKPNTTYTLSGDRTILAPQTNVVGTTTVRINMGLGELDPTIISPALNVAGTTRVVLKFTTGDLTSLNFFRLYNGSSAGGGDVWWDNIVLVESDPSTMDVEGYFDGDTPDDEYFLYSWEGVPHASVSIAKP